MDFRFLLTILIGLSLFSYTPLTAQCDSSAFDYPHNGIDEDCDLIDGLSLQMPTYIYMVEGKQFDLFYRNLFLSTHPEDYTFEVLTTLSGTDMSDHWNFTPSANDVGEHPLTLRIKDVNNVVLASASATVRIAPQTTPGTAPKAFIQMGHSLVDQGVMIHFLRQHTEEPGTPPVSFHGTRTSYVDGITNHEGKGGTSWRFYNQDSLSPLVSNGALDLKKYFDTVVCTDCAPDFFVIQLDVNEYCFTGFVSGKTHEETSDYIDADYEANIKPVIDALRTEAPNMKIGICLTPPANGRPGVFLSHFGSNEGLGNPYRWKKIVNSIIQKYTEYFAGREKENIHLLPIHLGVDDVNHFDDIDPIHPYPSNGDITKPNGYRSAARDMFAWMKWHMTDEAQGTCRINAHAKSIICDNNGTPDNAADDTFSFQLKADNTFGGSTWNAQINGQNVTGAYGAFEPLDGFPTQNPLLITLNDSDNANCSSLFAVSSESCSNGAIAYADLELSATSDTPIPTPFTTFNVEWKVKNNSDTPAQGVWLKVPKPAEVSFPNSTSFVASQGEYDWFYNYLWEVGEIPANGEATLTTTYYLLSAEIFPLYAEAYSMVQPDIDSEVHNGDYITANEDDEVVLRVGEIVSTSTPIISAPIRIYPNPVRGQAFTVLSDELGEALEEIQILNAQGQVVFSKKNNMEEERQQIQTNLPNGFYTLTSRTISGKISTIPFVIIR